MEFGDGGFHALILPAPGYTAGVPSWSIGGRGSQMAKRRKRLLVITVAVLAVVALLGVRWAWFPGRAFDPGAWQADAEVGSGVRQAMADRLLSDGP